MHTLIIGMTESGKSVFAKILSRQLKKSGRKVLVYDPLGVSEDWGATFFVDDPNELTEIAIRERSLHIFIDESTTIFDEGRNSEFNWLLTRGRHMGHSVYLIAQRAVQIPKTARDQTSRIYLFTSSMKDGEIHAEEWNNPALANCHQLEQLSFFKADRFTPAEKYRIEDYKNVKKCEQSAKKPDTSKVARRAVSNSLTVKD